MAGMVNPYLKLRWAEKHLNALQVLIAAFNNGLDQSKPCTFTREDDLENQRHILRVKLLDVPDPIPLTVGDAFYNMRACLDQLIWSLANRPGQPFGLEGTQFPILEFDNS